MATMVFTDAKIYLAGTNLSGVANEVALSMDPQMLDATVFGMATKKNTPGLWDIKADAKGFNDFSLAYPPAPTVAQVSSVDSILFASAGDTVEEVFTVAPVGNAEGDVAYLFKGVNAKYEPISGPVGALLPWTLDVKATGVRALRGFLSTTGTKSVTGNSVGVQFVGGIPAGKVMYAALHVIAFAGSAGPTLDVIVQSSAGAGFGAPTTRLTFPQFTASVGASWQSLAGVQTDDYYRMKWTIAGTAPQYTIFGVIGIL